jgi:hypothetical protein
MVAFFDAFVDVGEIGAKARDWFKDSCAGAVRNCTSYYA